MKIVRQRQTKGFLHKLAIICIEIPQKTPTVYFCGKCQNICHDLKKETCQCLNFQLKDFFNFGKFFCMRNY